MSDFLGSGQLMRRVYRWNWKCSLRDHCILEHGGMFSGEGTKAIQFQNYRSIQIQGRRSYTLGTNLVEKRQVSKKLLFSWLSSGIYLMHWGLKLMSLRLSWNFDWLVCTYLCAEFDQMPLTNFWSLTLRVALFQNVDIIWSIYFSCNKPEWVPKIANFTVVNKEEENAIPEIK